MTQTLASLTQDIARTVRETVGTDLALLRGYSEAKARSIAEFTLLLGQGFAAGEVSEARLLREKEELARMVARFVRNLSALAATAAERLAGRLMGLLTGAIGALAAAAGILLPAAI